MRLFTFGTLEDRTVKSGAAMLPPQSQLFMTPLENLYVILATTCNFWELPMFGWTFAPNTGELPFFLSGNCCSTTNRTHAATLEHNLSTAQSNRSVLSGIAYSIRESFGNEPRRVIGARVCCRSGTLGRKALQRTRLDRLQPLRKSGLLEAERPVDGALSRCRRALL